MTAVAFAEFESTGAKMADLFRNLLMGIGCLGLLWLGSCAMVGAGTVVAVSSASKKAGKWYEKEELKQHNEKANMAAAYHEHSDYKADYDENYED
ncbi:MAG: hypothetical protein NTX28_18075 [Novosphingobium sp.]|nr:hypothetical protein [Novosphingobium sp.]